MGKQIIRLTESDLHRIVKESVQIILAENGENEAFNRKQYANLAGQANGALNSFGGKLRGIFNPKWKARKERQMQNFGDAAANTNYNHPEIYSKDSVDKPIHDLNWNDSKTRLDYYGSKFNPDGKNVDVIGGDKVKNSPFELTRTQSYYTPNYNAEGEATTYDFSHHGDKHGETMSHDEFNTIYGDNGDMSDSAMNARRVSRNNLGLNSAYKSGIGAKGGMQNNYFKQLGKNNKY